MKYLTTKELSLIEDELRSEQLLAKTFNWSASQCEDEEIRSLLEQLAETHQLNIADLSQYFNRSQMIQ